MKKNDRRIFILVALLILIWIVFDFAIIDKARFSQAFEYSFESKTLKQIKEYAKAELDEYRLHEGSLEQVGYLVNTIECYHYLLYANKITVDRFYDFIRIVLLPSQRIDLKDKEKYVYEIKRYLRRKRNLDIKYTGYRVSEPVISKVQKDNFVQAYVIRTNTEGKEYLSYRFKKFKNRYYLYFEPGQAGTNFTLIKK